MSPTPSVKSKYLRIVLLLVLIFIASLAEAERLPIKTYTVADGLAHDGVNKIVRDSRGFLWFCTADGLSRFDGYTFTNYGMDQGLPHSNVNDLLETRKGEYWIATDGGLVHLNPKGRPSNRVVYVNDEQASASMFSVIEPQANDRVAGAVTVLLEDRNGGIWCGTRNGLFRIEQESGRASLHPVEIGLPEQYSEQPSIAALLEDKTDSLWIATPNGLYRRWSDGSAARYTNKDGLPDDHVSNLFRDHKGQLWAATLLGGFFRLIADESHKPPSVTQNYRFKNGLPTDWVFQMFENSEQRFWIATGRGLAEFFPDGDERGRHFHIYDESNGLSYHDITAMNEDLGGNLWLATNTAGVMKLARQGFVTYDEGDGVWWAGAIFEDRAGGICFRGDVVGDNRAGGYAGARMNLPKPNPAYRSTRFGRFDGEQLSWFNVHALDGFGWVFEHVTLQSQDGKWWVGTNKGLYRFPASDNFEGIRTAKPVGFYTTKDGLAALQVFRLFEDSRGDIWVATTSAETNGLARWDRASEKIYDLAGTAGLPSLKENLPNSFGEDSAGNVWIGLGTGLARFRQGKFQVFTTSDGLPPGAIRDIYRDRAGRLWLASARSGLVRVDDVESDRPAFATYTTAQGMSSNNTDVITEDNDGNIFAGGGHGLDRIEPTSGRVKHFTSADGLAPGSLRAAFRDHAGVLWFGTSKGISRLSPVANKPAGPPFVLITGLRIAGLPQPLSALGETDLSLPDFAPNQNDIQLSFVALGFASGEVLRYQYRLEGTDADWSALSEERTVNFALLAPGKYRFLVRAVNSDQTVSLAPAVVTFTILNPVWRRWWFIALVTLAVAGLAFLFYRYRVARLLEMANMRTRIATDLHDDIGANLTRISILSEVAKQRFRNDTRIPDMPPTPGNGHENSPLASIARFARESVGSMSDIVWAIDPERDSLLDLTRKMRQHAEEVFTLRDIDLQFNAPVVKETRRLGVDVRRDLLLMFKEAVNNTARHSRCTRVKIDLRLERSMLLLQIEDNGVGFDQSKESRGHGLRSMKRRAAALGGSLEITSQPDSGTVIKALVPAQKKN
jgi:ligand-binding sensor domain-containing protein